MWSGIQTFPLLSCFAAPASARRIHPPAFGRPPSPRGNLLPIFSIVGVIHRNAGLWRRAAPKAQDGWLGLEMTIGGKRHIGESGIPDVQDHPVLVISSGGSMLLGDTVKTATASRSREIFLGLGNTGFSPPQLLCSSRLFEADPSPGLWPSPFSKGELAYRYPQYVR